MFYNKVVGFQKTDRVIFRFLGCGINPARTFGPSLVTAIANYDTLADWWWIYYLGPLFGAVFATAIMCLFWGGRQPPSEKDGPTKQEYVDAGKVPEEAELDAMTI